MSSVNLDSVKALARARTQYLIAFDAIMIWDSLSTLRLEHRAIWQAKWTTTKVLYLLNRYGSMFWYFATSATILKPMSTAACQRVFWMQLVEVVYVLLVTHCILSVRLYAIFDRNARLKICLIAFLVFETALSIAAMSFFEPLGLPRSIAAYIGLEGCISTRKPGSPNLVLALNIIPSVFETSVLVAVAWKNWDATRRIGQKVPILKRLLRDGIVYYIVITGTHCTTAFMYAHGDPSVKTFNMPASIVLGSLACSRLILSLHQTRPHGGK
ncbi:hypothetical protein JCM11491_005599 [Sporobolomyces phaffii]